MFRYEYMTENAKYRATFYDEWQRLDSCMAATFEEHHLDATKNALRHKINEYNLYFVSYGTPIATIKYKYDLTDKHVITQTITINENSWDCSRSTIKQLSRWLKKLSYSHDISIPYYELKEMMLLIERHGYRSGESVFPSGTGFQVKPRYYYEMVSLFRSKCPFWSVVKC